ncbi:MAG: hypothetical protein N2B01_05355 [Psychrobacter cryohalolentis]
MTPGEIAEDIKLPPSLSKVFSNREQLDSKIVALTTITIFMSYDFEPFY